MRYFKMGIETNDLDKLRRLVDELNRTEKMPLFITEKVNERFHFDYDDKDYSTVTISQDVSEKGWRKRMDGLFHTFYEIRGIT